MKRLLLICFSLFICSSAIRAQGTSGVSTLGTPTVVVDTVHYYFNKYYFKTGTRLKDFPYYKSAFATTTLITHVGSKFENNEDLEITGLEAFISRHGSSTKLVIPVHLYLCTLENNLPKLPPIDSVVLSVSGEEDFEGPVGGNFYSGLTHTMTGNFALLLRNISIYQGDTVRVARTAGKTHTNVSVPWTEKNSDGWGYVRYNKQFYSTRDFTVGGGPAFPHNKNGFGIGTDYEFCIAPRVQYTITADHVTDAPAMNSNPDPNQGGVCVWDHMIYENRSSKRFLQRQYNLIEFARYWGTGSPLHPNTLVDSTTMTNIFPSDSSVGWFFAPEDNLFFSPDPRKFLPYNTQDNKMLFYTDSTQMSKLTGGDSVTCFYNNEFRTRYKTMSIYGRGQYLLFNDTFVICTKACGRISVGVNEQASLNELKVFPNPSTGKAVISGLRGGTDIRVYDILGHQVYSEATKSERVEIDLTQQPPGAYLIRISNGVDQRTVRFLRN